MGSNDHPFNTIQYNTIIRQVLERIGEKTLINDILRSKVNWVGHILRRNCLLHDAIDGLMTEVKGVGGRVRQLHDDMRRYWELNEEFED